MEVKSVVGDLQARARVVYGMVLGPRKFVVGLNILSRDARAGQASREGRNPLFLASPTGCYPDSRIAAS